MGGKGQKQSTEYLFTALRICYDDSKIAESAQCSAQHRKRGGQVSLAAHVLLTFHGG